MAIPIFRKRTIDNNGGDQNSVGQLAVPSTPAQLGEGDTLSDRAARFLLYLLVFLTPLWFLPVTAFPVVQNKQSLATVLVLLVVIIWFIKVLSKGIIAVPRTITLVAMIVFLVLYVAATVFSISPVTSIWGTNLQPDTALAMIVYVLAFFAIIQFFTKKEHLFRALSLFFVGLFILSIWSILHIFGIFLLPWDFARQRGFNPVGTVQGLSVFLGFGAVMFIALIGSWKLSQWVRLCTAFLLLVLMTILLLVDFRWVWLAMVLGMAAIVSWHIMRTRSTSPPVLRFPLSVLVIAAILLFLRLPLSNFVQLPIEISPSYSATLDIAQKTIAFPRTLLGSGPATFGYDYSLHRVQDLNYTPFWGVRFHQGFAAMPTLLATTGVFGFLSALVFIGLFVWTGFRGLATLAGKNIVLESIAIASFVGSFFLYFLWFFYPFNFTLAFFAFVTAGILIAAIWQGGGLKTTEFSILTSPQRTLLISLVLIAAIALSAIGAYWHVQKYIAAIFYGNGLSAFAAGEDVDRVIQKLSLAVNLDPSQDQYYRALSRALFVKAGQVLQRKDLKPEELQVQFQVALQSAIQLAQRTTEFNPIESANWVHLASLYENVIPFVQGAGKPAVDAYERVLALDPKSPQALLDISRALVLSADRVQTDLANLRQTKTLDRSQERGLQDDYNRLLDRALHFVNKAIELKRDFTPAHFLSAQIFERQGKRALAIQKSEEARNLNFSDIGAGFQLAYLYYLDGRLDDAKQEFERLVALNPNYSNARYFLGLIYDRQGDKAKAIEEFTKIRLLNPDNEEIKKILANLRGGKPALEGIVPPPTQRAGTPLPETGGAKEQEEMKAPRR